MNKPSPDRFNALGVTVAVLAYTIGYCVLEMVLHVKDDLKFVSQVGKILIMLLPLGLFMVPFMDKKTKKWKMLGMRMANVDEFEVRYKKKLVSKGWEAILITAVTCAALNLAINLVANVLRGLRKFALSPVEIYLFYSAIAVAETVTYCIAVVAVITGICWKLGIKNRAIPIIVASVVSGLLFSSAHLGVYGNVPEMLWSTGIAGTMMALFYGFTGNPFVPIFAHMVNNLIAASFVLVGTMAILL